MLAVVINTVMALGFLITLLFCIGDVEAALSTPTGFPTIQILYQATGSKAGATIIECMILLSTMIALFGVYASVSRLTWAFAKDNGLPFSDFFSQVSRLSDLQPGECVHRQLCPFSHHRVYNIESNISASRSTQHSIFHSTPLV